MMCAGLSRLVLCSIGMWLANLAWAQTTAFQALDRETARQLVQVRHDAQPTIVALWSAECTHCKKNLALFAELMRQDARVKLVSVATETLALAQIEPLERWAVSGERYAFGEDQHEALAYALDPKWRGELPRTFLFDGRGGKVALSGVLTLNVVKKALGIDSD